MVPFVPLVGALVALDLAAAASSDALLARWRSGEAIPHLEARLTLVGGAPGHTLEATPAGEATEPPPCIADFCQPRVDVPGFATRLGRPSRTELAATLLDRTGIEPFATIAWIFVATGLRVDWSPPVYDAGDPAGGRGWGSLFVRLKLRIDPMNHPVVPERRRARGPGSWRPLLTPRT
jgi:hypothetical protein